MGEGEKQCGQRKPGTPTLRVLARGTAIFTAGVAAFASFGAPAGDGKFINILRIKEVMAEPAQKAARKEDTAKILEQAVKAFQTYASSGSQDDLKKFHGIIGDRMKDDPFRKALTGRMASLGAKAVIDFILTSSRGYLEAAQRYTREFRKYEGYADAVHAKTESLGRADGSVSAMLAAMQQFADPKRKLAGEPPLTVGVADLAKAAYDSYGSFASKKYQAQEVRDQWGDRVVNDLFAKWTKAMAAPVRVAASATVATAIASFRSYVVDTDSGAWGKFSSQWQGLNEKQRSEFYSVLHRDQQLKRFVDIYESGVAYDTKAPAAALKECYDRLMQNVPGPKAKKDEAERMKRDMERDRRALSAKYGWDFVKYIHDNLPALSKLQGADAGSIAKALEGLGKDQPLRKLWHDQMMAPDRMLTALGTIRNGLDPYQTRMQVLSGHQVMSFALRECYGALWMDAGRQRVAKQYGEEFVAYAASRKDDLQKAGWLHGSAKRVAGELEKRAAKDELAKALLEYKPEWLKMEDFAGQLLATWAEVARKPNRSELEKRYGKAFVAAVADNLGRLGFASGDVKSVQAHLLANKDGPLVKRLSAAWAGQVASDKELAGKIAESFRDDLVRIGRERKAAVLQQYPEDLVLFAARMVRRRNDAKAATAAVYVMAYTALGKDKEGAGDHLRAVKELEDISKRYADDTTFNTLVLSMMNPVLRGGMEAWLRGRKEGGTPADFAAHVMGMKGVMEKGADRVYLRGLTGRSLSDVETALTHQTDKMKKGGSAEWETFVASMDTKVRAQYKAKAGTTKTFKWDDSEMRAYQQKLDARAKGRLDRITLDDMLAGLDYTHTMTENWTRDLRLHIYRVKENLAGTALYSSDYEDGFTLDPLGVGKSINAAVTLFSERQKASDALSGKYGKPLVEFVMANSGAFHEMSMEYRVAQAKNRTYHWMESKWAKGIGLRAFYDENYAGKMGQGEFQKAVLATHLGLWHFQQKKEALAEEHGRRLVESVERNLDSLKPVAAKWPQSKAGLDALAKTNPAVKEIRSLTMLDIEGMDKLEKQVTALQALHRQFFDRIVMGVQLEKKLESLGLSTFSFKDEKNKERYQQAIASTAYLTTADIAWLRAAYDRGTTKALGMKQNLSDMPIDWQIRFLERYVPEVREARAPGRSDADVQKRIKASYEAWVGRLEKTVTDTDFTDKFQKTLYTELLKRPEIKIAPDYKSLPAGLRDTLSQKVAGADVINQYLRLQPETRYEVFRAVVKVAGGTMQDALDFLSKGEEGIARFSALCSALSSVDQFYAPLLLRNAGATILRYQPQEIQILVSAIGGYTDVFANANAYHLLYDYYATLPGKIDRMFTTVADMYRKGVVQPGVRVLKPSEQDAYASLIVPGLNIIVNIPKTVYTQMTTTAPGAAGQALALNLQPKLSAGPLSAPLYDAVKSRIFEQGLISARVNMPLPMITAPLALSQIGLLTPDRLPNVGRFRNLSYTTQTGGTYTSPGAQEWTGSWSQEAKAWGYGKEMSMNVSGTFTNPAYFAAAGVPMAGAGLLGIRSPEWATAAAMLGAGGTSALGFADGITVDSIQSKGKNLGSLSVAGGWFPQEAGGLTNWDFTLQKNSYTKKLEDIKVSLMTVAPGGVDTIVDIERKADLNGDTRFTMHTYKRVGKGYKDDVIAPLTQDEGELYFQRAFGSSVDVWKTEAGHLAAPWGRGSVGTEHALIFADSGTATSDLPAGSTSYQGGGAWTPTSRTTGVMAAYEHTREGRAMAGGGYLNPDSKIIAIGRGYYMGTEDPARSRLMIQYSEIAPQGGGPVTRVLGKGVPATLDAFFGAVKLTTKAARMKDGAQEKDEGGNLLYDSQEKWMPTSGAVAQAIHKYNHWRVGALYTPEYFGGAGFVGSKDGIWAVVASGTQRKLEELYIKEALYGEYQPGDTNYKKADMSLLTGQILDASLGTQVLFPSVPLRMILGGAGYYYKPSETASGTSASSLLSSKSSALEIDSRAMETAYRRAALGEAPSWERIKFGARRSALMDVLSGIYTTSNEPQWAASAIAEFTLTNNILNTSEVSFRGLYLRSQTSDTDSTGSATTETDRSGGLAGAQFVWKPFSLEAYGELSKRNDATIGGGAAEMKLRLQTSPKLTFAVGGYRSGLADIRGGGHAGLLIEGQSGNWEAMGVGTFNEGFTVRTAEGALGFRLRTSPRLDLSMMATGIWQQDIESSRKAGQADLTIGARWFKPERNLIMHLYTGMQYWQAERYTATAAEGLSQDYTISAYRAFVRNIWEWYGMKVLKGTLTFNMEVGGGQMRESHRAFVDMYGNIILMW